MKIYKLTSIERDELETTVELNENQMEIIYRALREVSDMIFDEDDVYYSKEDADDLSSLFELLGKV